MNDVNNEQVYTPRIEHKCKESDTHYMGCQCHEAGWNMELTSLRDDIFRARHNLSIAVNALVTISAPKRNDGTYNYCREACEQIAKEALWKIGEKR